MNHWNDPARNRAAGQVMAACVVFTVLLVLLNFMEL